MAGLNAWQVKRIVEEHMKTLSASGQMTERQIRDLVQSEIQADRLPAATKWAVLKLVGAIAVGAAAIVAAVFASFVDSVADTAATSVAITTAEETVHEQVSTGFPALAENLASALIVADGFIDELNEDLSRILAAQYAEELRGPRGERGPIGLSAPLPLGSVIAFAGLECPEGWETFSEATGRMIVGAGVVDRYEVFTRVDGSLHYSIGGEEEVELRVAQMPPHRHELVTEVFARRSREEGETGERVLQGDVIGGDLVIITPGHLNTTIAGNGEPHNNMPPYIALHWCTPEGE